MLIFAVKIQENGDWEQVVVPSPAFAGLESPVQVLLLQKPRVAAGPARQQQTQRGGAHLPE